MMLRSFARRLALGGLVLVLLAVPSAQAARSEFFGVVQLAPLDDTDLQAIHAARINTVRFLVNWDNVEPSNGDFDWSYIDDVIGGHASHGIRGLPMLWATPSWTGAGSASRPPVTSPFARQAWKDFLKAAVDRYGPGGSYWTNQYPQQYGQDAVPVPITSWQIWNEPNHAFNMAGQSGIEQAIQEYAQLLQISHDTIKAEDPQAKIVTAGILRNPYQFTYDFLDGLYSVPGIKDDFDVLAIHTYEGTVGQNITDIELARQVMADHGDQATPLWITETGWASAPPDGYCPPPGDCTWVNFGPAGQANLLTGVYQAILANREAWNVQRVYWFDWRDPAPDGPFFNTCRRCPAAGLLGYDRTPKPSFNAFLAFSADASPPSASIIAGPRQGGLTNDPTPGFVLTSSEPGSTFACRIDARPWAACGSHFTAPKLSDGSHTLSVEATDAAGNESSAVSRSFAVATAEVSVSGSTLTVAAANRAKDNFLITRPSSSTLRVTDLASGSYPGSGIHTGAGCTQGGYYTVNCNAAGVKLIKVLAGGRGDQVVNSTAVRSALDGGQGDDNLIGGFVKDTLTGASGADVLLGMKGPDVLQARDLTSDRKIDCDGSGSQSAADKADLDMLPKDPNYVVKGCETKERH